MFLVALPQYPAIEARAPGIYPSLKLFDEYMNVTEIVSQYPSSQTQGVGRRLGRLQSARRFNCRKPTRVPRPACLPACLPVGCPLHDGQRAPSHEASFFSGGCPWKNPISKLVLLSARVHLTHILSLSPILEVSV